MNRMLIAASSLGGLLLFSVPSAWPQVVPGDKDDNRYSFNRVEDGYLRLDSRTGQVSLCARKPVGWACQAVPDERAALEGEIGRLQNENALLKKEMLARNLPLPGAVTPDPPAAKKDDPGSSSPNDPDLNKVMDFVEKVWRRLVEMITSLQKDLTKKS